MNTENKATTGTKLVEIRLSAMTRVEYTETMEVPADITRNELQQLVNSRYSSVDGGDYTDDPEYWERGHCYAEDVARSDVLPMTRAFRVEGGLHIERADCPDFDQRETTACA